MHALFLLKLIPLKEYYVDGDSFDSLRPIYGNRIFTLKRRLVIGESPLSLWLQTVNAWQMSTNNTSP